MTNHKNFKSSHNNIKLSLQVSKPKNILFLLMLALFVLMSCGNNSKNLGELKPLENLDEANFDSAIREGVVFVDFWAQWCGPCVRMKPYLQSVYHDNADKVKMYQVDVDTNKALANKYNIAAIPAVVAFVNGKEVKRLVGFNGNQKSIQSFVDAVLLEKN